MGAKADSQEGDCGNQAEELGLSWKAVGLPR